MRSRNPVYPLAQVAFFRTYISMATITTCPGTSLIPMETVLNRQEIFSFGSMPSPNISDLAKARQDFPSPKAE